MTSKKEEMIKSISSRILLFCSNNKNLSKINLNDGSVSAEDFFAELFNILYRDNNSKLFNTNKNKSNYPGIDLLDLENKKAIQVTVENTLSKIKSSFCKIPQKKDNEVYSSVEFIIQVNSVTKGMKTFGPKYQDYNVKVICIPDILREINNLSNLKHVEDICKFVENAIKVPDKVMANKQVDNEAFEILFQILKDRITKSDMAEIKDPISIYKSSPKEKRDKFDSDWKQLIDLYKLTLGMTGADDDHNKLINYENRLSECFSQDLNEIQKDLILKYLRAESFMVLESNQGKPLVAIGKLTEKIRADFNVGFLSKTQVMSFVLNMFFTCDVFPLEFKTNEED
jgi:hypothetical protein